MQNAIGCTTSGSPANKVALNPGGSVISFAACSAERPENFTSSSGGGGVSSTGLGLATESAADKERGKTAKVAKRRCARAILDFINQQSETAWIGVWSFKGNEAFLAGNVRVVKVQKRA